MADHTFFSRSALAMVSLAAALAWSPPAGSVDLVNGLGGPAGYGVGNLPANDDGSTASIDVTSAFPSGLQFFGMTFRSLYVNNNGNISFGGANGTFTPQAFPVSDLRMIAPWWGDVDTRNPMAAPPTHNGVYWSVTPGRFVTTWHNVGYYAEHDNLENDFQLLLTAAGPGVGDFDVEFRYHTCAWTTGDASGGMNGFGGTPAQAGFDAGDRVHYIAIPGSLSMAILNLCTTSNVGMPGVWRFTIRSGVVMCPGMGMGCGTGRPGVCAAGTTTCMGTTAVCTENTPASPEVCDGLDNDCNGLVDDGIAPRDCYDGPPATRAVGTCHDGTQVCTGGHYGPCTGETLPRAEVCNALDDDCNHAVDDGLGSTTCGEGTCTRTVPNCQAGMVQTCTPGEPDGSAGCIPQDAGTDTGTDTGTDLGSDAVIPDAGTPDGALGPDACHDYHCDPSLQLGGRAGPVGCACTAGSPRPGTNSAALAALAVCAVLATRRRRVHARPRG